MSDFALHSVKTGLILVRLQLFSCQVKVKLMFDRHLMDVYLHQHVSPDVDVMANSLAKILIRNMLNGIPVKRDKVLSSFVILGHVACMQCQMHPITTSGVLLKMDVDIRKRAWRRAWRYPAYLWSQRWVYAVKKIRRLVYGVYPPIHHWLLQIMSQ